MNVNHPNDGKPRPGCHCEHCKQLANPSSPSPNASVEPVIKLFDKSGGGPAELIDGSVKIGDDLYLLKKLPKTSSPSVSSTAVSEQQQS
jgi:hypothetical protein